MAKKKNTPKKHKFKHVDPLASQVSAPSGDVDASPLTQNRSRPAAVRSDGGAAATQRDFRYVGGDVRRIGVLAVSLIALELVLYYLLAHTSLGTAVYSLVKV